MRTVFSNVYVPLILNSPDRADHRGLRLEDSIYRRIILFGLRKSNEKFLDTPGNEIYFQ